MARHHYIPVFYLRQWATGADNRVCEFSRPYKTVVPKRVHPSGTAYKDDLYCVPGVPEAQYQHLEQQFLMLADQQASDAHQQLLLGNIDLPPKLRIGWTRFLMTLMSRTPERIAWIKKMYAEEFAKILPALMKHYDDVHAADPSKPTAKEKEADVARAAAVGTVNTLQRVMDLPNTGSHIVNMPWGILTLKEARHSLLTSDRPAHISDGLKKGNAVLTLPISPTKLFVAANDQQWLSSLRSHSAMELIGASNDLVARNAIDFVYGEDHRQLRYVENRLRRKLEPIKGILPRTKQRPFSV